MAVKFIYPKRVIRGWYLDPRQSVWMSPCGNYAAQRETSKRWSLWKLKRPTQLTSSKLISEFYRSLGRAIDDVENNFAARRRMGLPVPGDTP